MSYLFILLFWEVAMIYKILIASSDTNYNDFYSTFLENEKNYEIEKATTGLDTLNKYIETKPDVLILDTTLDYINYIDIINKLSMYCQNEKNKCNTILIINNLEEKLSLNNTAKIYQIFTKSHDLKHLLETIELMLSELNTPILTEKEINLLLTKLNFSLSSKGTKYIKSAITHYYYSQYSENTFYSLKELFEIVAKEYDTTIEIIRDGIRSSLIPLNTYREFSNSHSILKLFNNYRNITPKYFIETVSTYFHLIKNKNELNK